MKEPPYPDFLQVESSLIHLQHTFKALEEVEVVTVVIALSTEQEC